MFTRPASDSCKPPAPPLVRLLCPKRGNSQVRGRFPSSAAIFPVMVQRSSIGALLFAACLSPTLTWETKPVPVVGLAGVASLAAGTVHTCAVLEDGTGRCWGVNHDGQLGDGTTADR